MHDFDALSPLDFEELVRDLLQAHWGRSLESFGPGRDHGIDLRYLSGPDRIIVQAKHYTRSGAAALVRAVAKEHPKALALAPSRYIIATSVSLTPGLKEQIIAAMPNVPLVESDILGREDLNNLLKRQPDVLRQHFKLWLASVDVLERILHSGVYNRTAAELDQIRQMIPKFVQNQSVGDAEALLQQTGALIIAGAPGVGKTTLAQILLWRHAEQGWQIFVVDSVEEALSVANEGQKRLIFFDDFLGQVQLSAEHVRGIDARLPPLLHRVAAHKELRFVLTTRDYILAQAKALSQRLEQPTSSRNYLLNVGAYTRTVKARILYNHLYFSNLDPAHRDAILLDDFFIKIIDHKNFNPRLIEMLTRADYLSMTDRPVREVILHALDNPHELWERPFRQHMSKDARLLLIALAINGALASIDMFRASFWRVARALDMPVGPGDAEPRFRIAFRELEGSALSLTNTIVQFANPGLRDYLNSVIAADNLLLAIVPQVETVAELEECLAIHRSRTPPNQRGAGDTWVAAFDRLVESDASDRYQRLELGLDIYDMLLDDAMLPRLEQAVEAFSERGFGFDDISDACSLLERTAAALLPIGIHDKVRQAVADATAGMIHENAGAFNFEDIQSLDKALEEYGIDETSANDAMWTALDALARSVDEDVDAIETLDALDEYEETLVSVMRRRGYSASEVKRDIERRRDRLSDWDEPLRDSAYRGGGSGGPQMRNGDDHIKSMFAGLASKQ